MTTGYEITCPTCDSWTRTHTLLEGHRTLQCGCIMVGKLAEELGTIEFGNTTEGIFLLADDRIVHVRRRTTCDS